MQHVYPKLAEFCREKYGLEFQVSFNAGKVSFRTMIYLIAYVSENVLVTDPLIYINVVMRWGVLEDVVVLCFACGGYEVGCTGGVVGCTNGYVLYVLGMR